MTHVSDHMICKIIAIEPRQTALEAARIMTDQDVDALAVTDAGRLLGMITQADIVHAVAAERDIAATSVAKVMLPEVLFCYDDQSAEEAIRKMQASLVRRLPVLSKEKVLLGMVCEDDLLALPSEPKASADEPETSDVGGIGEFAA
ncbi:MAG: CBS domain-containing protein [Rhodospirillales bacterium]|nr:CBS domain-containing protein [Rhodospirillales bacterium]